jgi:hypothetical protein
MAHYVCLKGIFLIYIFSSPLSFARIETLLDRHTSVKVPVPFLIPKQVATTTEALIQRTSSDMRLPVWFFMLYLLLSWRDVCPRVLT